MVIRIDKGSTGYGYFVSIIAFITVLSQLPVFVESGITGRISIAAWLLLAAVSLFRCRGLIPIREILTPLSMVVVLMLYYCTRLIVNDSYARSALPYPILISMFVLLVGKLVGLGFSKSDIERVFRAIVLGCVILAVAVYMKFFRGVTNFSRIYLYSEKNSTAQILMTGIILILTVLLNSAKSRKKLIHMGAVVILSAMILMMRSRATLVFVPVLVFLLLTQKNISKKMRWGTVVVVLAAVVILMLNDEYRRSLVDDILFAGRDGTDINSISSGRADEWGTFLADLGDKWLFGHGRMKRESLILTSILEYGVIFGTLILALAVYPLYYGVCRLAKTEPYRPTLITVASCYAVNGIFEQLAPFGPGVKCFFLWFLLGLLSCRENASSSKNKISDLYSEERA